MHSDAEAGRQAMLAFHSFEADGMVNSYRPPGFPTLFGTLDTTSNPNGHAGTMDVAFEYDHDLGQLALSFHRGDVSASRQVVLEGFPQGAVVRPWARMYDKDETVRIIGWMAS